MLEHLKLDFPKNCQKQESHLTFVTNVTNWIGGEKIMKYQVWFLFLAIFWEIKLQVLQHQRLLQRNHLLFRIVCGNSTRPLSHGIERGEQNSILKIWLWWKRSKLAKKYLEQDPRNNQSTCRLTMQKPGQNETQMETSVLWLRDWICSLVMWF